MNNNDKYLKKEEQIEENCCEKPCIDFKAGNKVCINCGMVLDVYLVDQERRAYSSEEVKERKQTEPRWREFGSRTMLSDSKIDYKGHYLSAEKKTLFSRLSKIQNSLISGIERNFWEAKPKIKQLSLKLNLPDHIQETAWKVYALAAKKKLTMGRSIEGFITASLYVAIRIHEFPKLLEEISDTAMISRRLIIHSLALLLREVLPELNLSYKPINVKQLIFKFGSDLNLSMDVQKLALNMVAISTKKGLSLIGKDPKGFAASALYLATKESNQKKTQSQIAKTAKITEVTLRTRVKEMKKKITLVI